MNEWKIRQEIFHRLKTEHSDDLSDKHIEISKNTTDDAVRYFKETNVGWIYPAKSYMVGICYAKWLSDQYGNTPLHYLNDSMLLYGNDPYFVEYSKDPTTYDNILDKINGWNFDQTQGLVPDVKTYFIEEFLLNE
jgi:hypothetical protein